MNPIRGWIRRRGPSGAAVLALTLAACEGRGAEVGEGEAGDRAVQESPPTAAAPVIRGLGGPTGEPAIADTIDMRTIGYSRGEPDAPVTVYEFSDFGCPFCAMFAQGTYPGLHEEFVRTGQVRWTYVPFVMGIFPNGAEAAAAAECAGEQDRFWEMHDRLYARQNEWKSAGDAARLFDDYARAIGVDPARFAACYRADAGAPRTRTNNRAADGLRVRATPSFFINGRLVEGALPVEQFRELLRAQAGAR